MFARATVVILLAVASVSGQQKLIENVTTLTPADATLAVRRSGVDAMIRCRIDSSQSRFIPTPYTDVLPPGTNPLADVPTLVTEHSVTILEVFKPDVRLPGQTGTTSVLQRAGSAPWNGYVISVSGAFKDVFHAGGEYVLFLDFSDYTSSFWVSPFYVYWNNNGVVATSKQFALEQQYDGMSWASFLAVIRGLAG